MMRLATKERHAPTVTEECARTPVETAIACGEVTAAEYLASVLPAELILSDEPELESPAHLAQLFVLMSTLTWLWGSRTDIFFAGNASVYWTLETLKKRRFTGPDLFIVLNVTPKERNSWVVWAEDGRFPDVIVELLSKKTARTDRTRKRELYQNTFRTPEYFWFDPKTKEFMGLRLADGVYQEIAPNAQGHRWSAMIGMYLGVVDGTLRFLDHDGVVVPTLDESEKQRAEVEAQRADTEAQRADTEAQRADTEKQRANAEHQARRDAEEQVRRLTERLRQIEEDQGMNGGVPG